MLFVGLETKMWNALELLKNAVFTKCSATTSWHLERDLISPSPGKNTSIDPVVRLVMSGKFVLLVFLFESTSDARMSLVR